MRDPLAHRASTPKGVIPLSVPEIRGNEWKYVRECLDTNWVSTAGPFVHRFERMVGDYVGAKYAVATVNGTAALHIALLVAGVQADDEVLVSTFSFIAPANAVRYVGAWPVFVDAEPKYWQMDPEKVKDFLEKECRWLRGRLINKKTGRQVRAILPVHVLGHPVDLDPILEVARKYELVVIEDAAESLGALYKDRKAGHLGDIACISFNGNKIITTGGGGMIHTDNESWAAQAKYLTTQARDDANEYIHESVGYNYRLTNIQAAIGVGQMEVLGQYVQIKRAIAAIYASELGDLSGVTLPQEAAWAFSTFWLYTILVDATDSGVDRRMLQRALAQRNIQSGPLWMPIHEQRPYRGCQGYRIEVAKRLYNDGLSLPCSVGLQRADQERIIATLHDLFRPR
jgi:perosamine synthetase